MGVDLAEVGREGQLLVARDVLVAEEQNLALQQQGLQRVALRAVQRLAQVDPADFRTDGRVDLDRAQSPSSFRECR
jgi:hypothetical protein